MCACARAWLFICVVEISLCKKKKTVEGLIPVPTLDTYTLVA